MSSKGPQPCASQIGPRSIADYRGLGVSFGAPRRSRSHPEVVTHAVVPFLALYADKRERSKDPDASTDGRHPKRCLRPGAHAQSRTVMARLNRRPAQTARCARWGPRGGLSTNAAPVWLWHLAAENYAFPRFKSCAETATARSRNAPIVVFRQSPTGVPEGSPGSKIEQRTAPGTRSGAYDRRCFNRSTITAASSTAPLATY